MNIFNFFREVKAEMKHMNWPSRRVTMAYTILVIVVSLAVAVYVGVFDHFFTLGIEQLIN